MFDGSYSSECVICGFKLDSRPNQENDAKRFQCRNCGEFRITGTAEGMLPNNIEFKPERAKLLAHMVRRRYAQKKVVDVDSHLIKRAFDDETRFPNAFEQVTNLIIWLAENLPYPGSPVPISYMRFQAIVGAASSESFDWVLRSAMDKGWIDGHGIKTVPIELKDASLTFSGWEWYETDGKHQRSKTAFIAMKFKDDTLNNIVKKHFDPAVRQAGFRLMRLDDYPAAGIIDNRMRVEIRRSRFLIADLTHRNAGAYWEAGFAEGLGMPVIFTCKESTIENVHFDARNCQIVPWNENNPEIAVELLKAAIRNTLPEEAQMDDLED